MLDPLYTAVSWVLLRWYQLFTVLGMDKQGGLTWALSIIMLVVTATRVVTIILVIVSAAATFITQRAVIANQTTPAEGQAAMIQKLMLVGIPISVVVSGFIFPLGVLLYWFTSNLWTMGQQFYIH